jgi:multidrug efflux pump subunit AcrB
MYMTPAMCAWFIKVKQLEGGTGAQETDTYDSRFYRIYRGALNTALHGRIIVVGLTVALLAGAAFGSTFVVREFFGPSDRNQFLVYIYLPAGSRITATDEVVRQFTAWLEDDEVNPEVANHIAYVGTGGPRFFLSLSPIDPDPHVAFAVVNTERADQTPEVVERVRSYLIETFANVNPQVKRMWMGSNEPGYVEFRLIGLDPDYIYAKSKELEDAIWQQKGIDYARNDWENRVLRINAVVDQARARRAGVTSREVALSLEAFLDGKSLTDYREGDVAIPVVLQAVDEERQALGDLWNINVYSSSRGINVPLTQIANIKSQWQFSRIAREDQERTVTIETKHQFLKAPQYVAALMPALEALDLKPGYRWEIGGEIEESAETNEKLFGPLPACGLLIVVLLIWQFNSFRRPLIIMLTIPMAFAGALIGLFVMRAPFDFFAILGLLSLAGVIINNGIVLIDRIDGECAAGTAPYQAVVQATISRFRPIMMSAVTTMLGVLPLIIFRDPLFYSLACVIAFGLALGTVLSLLVVPVLYSLFMRIKPA